MFGCIITGSLCSIVSVLSCVAAYCVTVAVKINEELLLSLYNINTGSWCSQDRTWSHCWSCCCSWSGASCWQFDRWQHVIQSVRIQLDCGSVNRWQKSSALVPWIQQWCTTESRTSSRNECVSMKRSFTCLVRLDFSWITGCKSLSLNFNRSRKPKSTW